MCLAIYLKAFSPPCLICTYLDCLNQRLVTMSNFETPSSALQAGAEKYPDLTLLKKPTQSPEGVVFEDVTFTQFRKDVELAARYWKNQLSQVGAGDRAVVGVW